MFIKRSLNGFVTCAYDLSYSNVNLVFPSNPKCAHESTLQEVHNQYTATYTQGDSPSRTFLSILNRIRRKKIEQTQQTKILLQTKMKLH